MNRLRHFQWTLLASAVGLVTSCTSLTPEATTSLGRFREASSADLVLRFYSWNSIQMTRPDTRESGFLPLMNREGVQHQLGRPDLEFDLAVVVVGFMFSMAQESALFQDWNMLLRERGFRRVVLVRAGFKDEIDGLPVLYDSAMAATHDDQIRLAATVAAVPATARANVADPWGYSRR